MATRNTSSMPLIDINFCFRFFDLEFLDSFSIIVYIVSDALLQLSDLYPLGICYQFLGLSLHLGTNFVRFLFVTLPVGSPLGACYCSSIL